MSNNEDEVVEAVDVATADQDGRLLDSAVYADAPEEQPATD